MRRSFLAIARGGAVAFFAFALLFPLSSFAQMFSEKYARVRQFGHPVMIAEFGVAGSNGHQREWLHLSKPSQSNC